MSTWASSESLLGRFVGPFCFQLTINVGNNGTSQLGLVPQLHPSLSFPTLQLNLQQTNVAMEIAYFYWRYCASSNADFSIVMLVVGFVSRLRLFIPPLGASWRVAGNHQRFGFGGADSTTARQDDHGSFGTTLGRLFQYLGSFGGHWVMDISYNFIQLGEWKQVVSHSYNFRKGSLDDFG